MIFEGWQRVPERLYRAYGALVRARFDASKSGATA